MNFPESTTYVIHVIHYEHFPFSAALLLKDDPSK